MQNVHSRRSFLKLLPLATVGLLVSSKEAAAQALPTAALDEGDAMAKTMGYSADALKVDNAKFPKHSGPEGAKQFCSNCILMTQGGLKVEGKEGEWGKCALFQNGLVNLKGWCNSWAPKAA